jgi:hypothetical protein
MNNTHTQLLAEVLRAQPPVNMRLVKPARLPVGSVADRIIDTAAAQVRTLYVHGKRAAASTEAWFDACFDTYFAYHELSDAIPDDRLLSLANAVFDRAGIMRENVHPTTLRAQVDMQITALEAARNAERFLAQQASFALEG